MLVYENELTSKIALGVINYQSEKAHDGLFADEREEFSCILPKSEDEWKGNPCSRTFEEGSRPISEISTVGLVLINNSVNSNIHSNLTLVTLLQQFLEWQI